MEFSVEFTAYRKVRSAVHADVFISDKEIRARLDREIECSLQNATYDGAIVTATISADLTDAIQDAIENGRTGDGLRLEIQDADLDGDVDQWEDADIETVEPTL